MDEHLVFFIDFLGFKEAIRDFDQARMTALLRLLRDLAALRSEFAFSESPIEGTGIQFRLKPAITTFSDHIVISFLTDHLRKIDGRDSLGTGLLLAQPLIAALAAESMRLGILIRGGATVGSLYHSGGVVVGEAMLEAYELETRVSNYPRIAVSRKIYSQTNITPRTIVLLEDGDGITHFNYFSPMITAGGQNFGDRVGTKSQMIAWLADAQQIIAKNSVHFEHQERWNELSKWAWFKQHIEQARAALPNELFE